MAIENFTTYTEVDPNSRIEKTASRVTWTDLARNEDAYVYKDKGANYYSGDFTFTLAVRITGGSKGGLVNVWGVENAIDDFLDQTDCLVVWSKRHDLTDVPYLCITEVVAGNPAHSGTYNISYDTTYYLRVWRDESEGTYGKLYCYIYGDSEMTELLTGGGITLRSKADFRYLYATQSYNSASGQTISGYIENLEEAGIPGVPSVTTYLCTDIDHNSGTGHGEVTDLGDSDVTQHGHCWSTSQNPTTADDKTENGAKAATGLFTSAITGLDPETLYYVRAYATNTEGTSYGDEVELTTGATPPALAVTTNPATAVGQTTATLNGTLDADGGEACECGFEWGLDTDYGMTTPTESKITDEDFSQVIGGLAPGTTYHFRAFATNSVGTSYGADRTFTTTLIISRAYALAREEL